MKTAILGCGYVGSELARRLNEQGHQVIAIRRSKSALESIDSIGNGVSAMRADVTDSKTIEAIPDVDALIYTVSAGRSGIEAGRKAYIDGLQNVIDVFGSRTKTPNRLVYTSSTGVYGDHNGRWVDESTPLQPSNERTRILGRAETIAQETAAEGGISGTVVRFGGLYGPERYRLERYLDRPVTAGIRNMLHRDDAAGILEFLLNEGRGQGEIIVAVDDEPVDKHEFADWLADKCAVSRPPKQSVDKRIASNDLTDAANQRLRADKRCSNGKLKSMGYEFVHPTFRSGYQPAVVQYNKSA